MPTSIPISSAARSARSLPRWAWLVSAAAVVLMAAAWIRTQQPVWLWMSALAVLVAIPALGRTRRVGREVVFLALAVLFIGEGMRSRFERVRREADWPSWSARTAARATEAFALRIEQTARELRAAARAAASGASVENADTRWSVLAQLVRGHPERAILRAKGGRAEAWAGRLHLPIDSLPASHGVMVTPFYLALYVAEREGDVTAIATALLHAEPPASAFTQPLDVASAREPGVAGYMFGPANAEGDSVRRVLVDGDAVLAVRAIVAPPGVVALEAAERTALRSGALWVLLALLFIATAWRRDNRLLTRHAALTPVVAAVAVLPLGAYSNFSRWFDAGLYYTPTLGPLTANVAALATVSALALMALFAVLRRPPSPRTRWTWIAVLVVVAAVSPFLLRDLARGIRVPSGGVTTELWLAWEVSVFLAAFATLLLGVTAGQAGIGARRGVPGWLAPLIAAISTLMAPVLLQAPARLPGWYPVLWIAAIGALAVARRARRAFLRTAFVAACGAVTLVWASSVRQRVQLAERDVAGLGAPDPYAQSLLQRMAAELAQDAPAPTRVGLLARYAASELGAAGYPAELTSWDSAGRAVADLRVAMAAGSTIGLDAFAAEARRVRTPVLRQTTAAPVSQFVLAVPHAGGEVTTIVISPRTKLVPADPFIGLLGLGQASTAEPPYSLQLGDDREGSTAGERWTRRSDELHGDWAVPVGDAGAAGVHARVELRGLEVLAPRGALLVMVNLLLVSLLWGALFAAEGTAQRWVRAWVRGWPRSYRLRLSLALFAFFVLPAGGFAAWTYRRLQADDRQSRDLLVRETLRGVATSSDSVKLSEAAARFETPLLLYADGLLLGTSDALYDALAPVGRLLPPGVVRAFGANDDLIAGMDEAVGSTTVRFGYRAAVDPSGVRLVLSAPARSDELALDRRRRDVAVLVLVVTALGALAAFWLSGIAARTFARPIDALRRGALAVASGAREPLPDARPPVEFEPVFTAFRQMAADLGASRDALEAAERRLAAVLRDVASGVVAVDADGLISLINPRAVALLPAGALPGALADGVLEAALAERLRRFLAGVAEQEEFDIERPDGVQLHVRLTRLLRGARGAVITLDDLSALARAQRVLAWGEMARQVAHEIKNPLTPMRLGMQHLRRARRDARVDFDQVLEQNVERMLAEIDRLDEIARAFSRYGMVPEELAPPGDVDVAGIVEDVVRLEQLGAGDVVWTMDGTSASVTAQAREPELREALLNVLENARHAQSRQVRVSLVKSGGVVRIVVRDDGHGISPDVLPRVFEPHFSTRTSGSGLGLAISRRLIEGWGGGIEVASAPGEGTIVTIRLVGRGTA
ncbi:MAG: ATP-binding protein [Gemmatimonadota bacterium]|nr:ATP-binding protein [Gemmatimonadota bacterium]